MTSIAALLTRMPSLVNYLSSNGSGGLAGTAQNLTARPGAATGGIAAAGSAAGDNVTLSAAAKAILAQQKAASTAAGSAAGKGGSADAKTGALSFVQRFFTESGVDGEALSDEATTLLSGLAKLIKDMESPAHDAAFDSMTKAYVRGQRESYTLQGQGERLTATIQYSNGKPVSLTVTQLIGTNANTATITLGRDSEGAPATIEVDRVEKKYSSFGGLTGTNAAAPLSLALYA